MRALPREIILGSLPSDLNSILYLSTTKKELYNFFNDSLMKKHFAENFDYPKTYSLSEGKTFLSLNSEEQLNETVKVNDSSLVHKLIMKHGCSKRDYNTALLVAAKKGYFDIVHMFIETPEGPVPYEENDALVTAAYHGHTKISRYLMKKVWVEPLATFNHVLVAAADGEHADIVQFLLDVGASRLGCSDYYKAIKAGKYSNIVRLLIKAKLKFLGDALFRAVNDNKKYVVAEILKEGRDYLTGDGSISIVLLLMEYITKPNDAMAYAAEAGYMNIVQLILENGVTDYDIGLVGAVSGGHADIIEFMLEKGATNYEGALEATDDAEIIELITHWRQTH